MKNLESVASLMELEKKLVTSNSSSVSKTTVGRLTYHICYFELLGLAINNVRMMMHLMRYIYIYMCI